MINLYIIDNKANRSSIFGIGTYINQMELILQQSNLNVCFIHLNADSQRFFREVENYIEHWYIPYPKVKYKDEGKHNKLYFQNVLFLLRLHIQQTDNLIFHLNYLKHKSFVEELKMVFNCKIIIAVHYFAWCFDIMGNVSRLKSILGKPDAELDQLGRQVKKSFNEEKELVCSVDKVLSLSKNTAKILQNLYQVKKQNISIIYNGLEDKAPKYVDREMIRKKYNLPVEAPVIIFAGRLDPVKGLSYFIQALKKILNQFSNCQIVIAGSGDYDACMKACENRWMNIHFTGLLEKSELYELYSIADFGVMPSLHEQCSYVAIEMMMHGLPIIASNSTGLSEMIDEGVTGFHVQVLEFPDKTEIDTSMLEEKIFFLLQHLEECKFMRINARRRYETTYSFKLFRKNMLAFYRSLAYKKDANCSSIAI